MTNVSTDTEICDHAVVCAMRFKWGYPGYETLEKTSVALRRKCKGTMKTQRQDVLSKAMLLNDDAEQRTKELAMSNTNMHPDDLMNSEDWSNAIRELKHQHPKFSNNAVNSALSWGLYWGVLR
jgi:hypothetical protein